MNAGTAKAKTIVFVEDDPVVLTAYRNCLEREGIYVEPARDGLEAIKILSRLVPDLVILDLLLPKFNGAEVLRFMHSHSHLKTIPVFILSNNSLLGTAEEPVLERATQRLLKNSCTPATLVRAVRKLLTGPSSSGNTSSAHQPNGAQTPRTRTVVFVEDNPVVLMAYQHRLQAGGFRVKPARDGLEAMKILSRLVPDLLILDLLLPKFNGVEVLKFVQSNARLAAVPIIILSTNSIIDATEEYVLERADKRLLKSSCTPAIILQTIRELLCGEPAAVQRNDSESAESKTGDILAETPVAN